MRIKFTFGDAVTINLIQNIYGFYIYVPKNKVTSSIEFFSIKNAILFFSEFLPVKVYDMEEDDPIIFKVNIEYKNVEIAFYISDKDRTNIGWSYTVDSKEFNDFLLENRKKGDSIDDLIMYLIAFVDSKKREDNKLEINGRSYLIKYDEGNKEYYTAFTSNLKFTGKSIEEVKGGFREIYKIFGDK